MVGEFIDWDLVGCFLEFDDLLVDEFGFFVNDKVGVYGIFFGWVIWDVSVVVCLGESDVVEIVGYVKILCVFVCLVFDVDFCCF